MTAVVTGYGAVTPAGTGVDQLWESISARTNHITVRPPNTDGSIYRHTLQARVVEDVSTLIPSRLVKQTDVSTQLALVAAEQALEMSQVTVNSDPFTLGVCTGNALGGFAFTHNEFRKLWAQGPAAVSVYESFAWFYAVNTGQISIRHGLKGPGRAVVTEQASGLDAIGAALDRIDDGTQAVLTGGADSAFDPWGWVAHAASARMTSSTDPKRAYQPFSPHASGYVPGEGGAMLVLEDHQAATSRHAHALGTILAHASTFDAQGDKSGSGLARAIRECLRRADASPADVDVVYLDAVGTPDQDTSEAHAIRSALEGKTTPCTAPKTGYGRLFSGSGPVDVITALLGFEHHVIPGTPTADENPPIDHDIDLVIHARHQQNLDLALVLSRGRLGFNSVVAVAR